MFNHLYQLMFRWSVHPSADRYLACIAFIESCVFPLPVEVMLAPMAFSKPNRYVKLAIIATLFSVLGGMLGYGIGMYGYDFIQPWIEKLGYSGKYQVITRLFDQWGFWIIFVAGFSPLPYKLFTIAAGAFGIGFLPFVLASIVGRASRFFLVSLLFSKLGPKLAPMISRYIEWLGWLSILALVALIWIYSR